MRTAGDLARLAVVAVAAAASMATPAPRYHYPRNYPVWQVESGGSFEGGCVKGEAWVAKSGKQGIGVVLELTPRGDAPCHLTLLGTRLLIGGVDRSKMGCPYTFEVPAGGPHQAYLPFAFDNQAAWNDGHRRGVLELEMITDGMMVGRWSMALVHAYAGPHRTVEVGDDPRYMP